VIVLSVDFSHHSEGLIVVRVEHAGCRHDIGAKLYPGGWKAKAIPLDLRPDDAEEAVLMAVARYPWLRGDW
jgi:hypothetical protein